MLGSCDFTFVLGVDYYCLFYFYSNSLSKTSLRRSTTTCSLSNLNEFQPFKQMEAKSGIHPYDFIEDITYKV